MELPFEAAEWSAVSPNLSLSLTFTPSSIRFLTVFILPKFENFINIYLRLKVKICTITIHGCIMNWCISTKFVYNTSVCALFDKNSNNIHMACVFGRDILWIKCFFNDLFWVWFKEFNNFNNKNRISQTGQVFLSKITLPLYKIICLVTCTLILFSQCVSNSLILYRIFTFFIGLR